jgi:hypothetical protein
MNLALADAETIASVHKHVVPVIYQKITICNNINNKDNHTLAAIADEEDLWITVPTFLTIFKSKCMML